jgi:hypothetical protein
MAKQKIKYKATKVSEPDVSNMSELNGQEFGRLKNQAMDYYRLNHNSSDYKKWTMDWIESNEEWKDKQKVISKNSDSAFSSSLGSLCRLLANGMPDVHEDYKKYWESLSGTMGEVKPCTDYINARLQELHTKGLQEVEQVEEEKKEVEKSGEPYRPSIQERIREASYIMTEFIEQAFDDFYDGKINNFSNVKVLSQLRQIGCKQPHARIIKIYYDQQKEEFEELLNPPDTSKMSELEKDHVQQLKEGYALYDKKQIKALYMFLETITSACDGIIAESKANRKPRKLSKKSPEKIVEKLKYKVTDEKYNISSMEPWKFIQANCLVVFNSKNRKLGIYYTKIEDPLGQKRDGTGLMLKGQTILNYNEETSVWKTLRKPVEQLQEVKTLNTRRKFENWFEPIKSTPTKMNGRINPETILIGVY